MEPVMVDATVEEIPMESEYTAEEIAMYGPAPWSEEKANWYGANISWTIMALFHTVAGVSAVLKLSDYSTWEAGVRYVMMGMAYLNAVFWAVGSLTQILSMFFIAVEINMMWWMEAGMIFAMLFEVASLAMWYFYDGYKVLCNTDSVTNATQCGYASQMEEDSAYAMATEAFTGVVMMQISKDWFDGQWDMLPIDTKMRIVQEKQDAMMEKKEEMKEEMEEEWPTVEGDDMDMDMVEMFRYFLF